MSDSSFDVNVLRDDARLIRTGSALDNSNADQFASLLTDLHGSDIRYIIIDMTNLEFLSSAGVGSILGTVELFRERKGDIVLTGVGEKILHVLNVLDLTEYLTLRSTTQEATVHCGL